VSSRSLVLLFVASSALAVTACVDRTGLSQACDDEHPCADGRACVDGLCAETPADDDGGAVVVDDAGAAAEAGTPPADAGSPPQDAGGGVEDDGGEPPLDAGRPDSGLVVSDAGFDIDAGDEADAGEPPGDDAGVDDDAGPRCTGDGDDDGYGDGDDCIGPDNCPSVHNPDQHDEDQDTVGDVCDNCPGIPNLDQANTTELNAMAVGDGGPSFGEVDGVGDLCDAHPDHGGDEILYFHPFHRMEPGWDQREGEWSNDGDDLVVDDRAEQAGALIVLPEVSRADSLTVETRAEYLCQSTGASCSVGPGAQFDNDDNGWVCAMGQGFIGLDGLSLSRIESNVSDSQGVDIAATAPNTPYRVFTSIVGDEVKCFTDTGLVVERTRGVHPGDGVALRSRRASGRFRYIVVYSYDP
jgi:hypothetical protein